MTARPGQGRVRPSSRPQRHDSSSGGYQVIEYEISDLLALYSPRGGGNTRRRGGLQTAADTWDLATAESDSEDQHQQLTSEQRLRAGQPDIAPSCLWPKSRPPRGCSGTLGLLSGSRCGAGQRCWRASYLYAVRLTLPHEGDIYEAAIQDTPKLTSGMDVERRIGRMHLSLMQTSFEVSSRADQFMHVLHRIHKSS